MVGNVKTVKLKNKTTQVLLNEEVLDFKHYYDDEFTELDPQLVKDGMSNEATSLDDFDVYDTVLIPIDASVLSTRWGHRLKEELVKSRLVVRGFEQLWTEAFTCSPTPSLSTPADSAYTCIVMQLEHHNWRCIHCVPARCT
jgi:hypothetical protein